MSNSLIKRLESLSPAEKALISKLLGVTEEAEVTKPTEKPTSKRKQRRKTEKVEELPVPRKKIVEVEEDLDDADDEPKLNTANLPGRARRVKTREQAKREQPRRGSQQVKGRRSKGSPARTEAVDLRGGRPNRFERMPAFNAEKGDAKIDALLNKGRQPTERRDAVQFVEAECTRCGDIWEVPPTFIYNDDEGNNFICDTCRGRGAK